VGTRVQGKVVSITNYGAFIELEPGIEGLVHVSEMSWTKRIAHPSKVVNVGDEVDVIVLDVDTANRRISLGLKQAEPNPWEMVRVNHPIGSHIQGAVKNVTDFGVFVEIEEGVEGLIHVSQLSTERIDKPQSMFENGQEIEAEVTSVDTRDRKIALSVKALRRSEERDEIETYLQREREGGRFSFEDILSADLRLDRDEAGKAEDAENGDHKNGGE
jgi:small subunit ribosomal protein S1